MKPLQSGHAERAGSAEPALSGRDVQGGNGRLGWGPRRNRGALPESPISKLWPRGAGGLYVQSRSFEIGPKGNGYLYRVLMRRIGAAAESRFCQGQGISVLCPRPCSYRSSGHSRKIF
jgi:hypothetical protein